MLLGEYMKLDQIIGSDWSNFPPLCLFAIASKMYINIILSTEFQIWYHIISGNYLATVFANDKSSNCKLL